MRNLSAMVMAVLVMGVAAGQAAGQLPFTANFDALTNGGLDGQDGWSADTQMVLSDNVGNPSSEHGYAGSRGASAQGVLGNFSATHGLGTTLSSGIITASALIQASAGGNPKGGSVFLSDGAGTILEVEALGGGANSQFNVKGPGGNIQTDPPFPAGIKNCCGAGDIENFNDSGWVQVEVEYNLGAGSAVGRVRDVLEFDNPGAVPPVLSAIVLEVDFPSFTAFNVNTVGIKSNSAFATNPGRVDNVEVTFVPEPATAMLLGLGGLLMLKRRR